ncbi:MAG: hypothetical protein Q3X80_02555, partial [Oscillospiraceae bacterium]|nr:hypothetical protein [Oscillospiraceae bacterium]
SQRIDRRRGVSDVQRYAISLLFFLFSLPNPKQSQEKGQGAIPALFLCLREGDGCMQNGGKALHVYAGEGRQNDLPLAAAGRMVYSGGREGEMTWRRSNFISS